MLTNHFDWLESLCINHLVWIKVPKAKGLCNETDRVVDNYQIKLRTLFVNGDASLKLKKKVFHLFICLFLRIQPILALFQSFSIFYCLLYFYSPLSQLFLYNNRVDLKMNNHKIFIKIGKIKRESRVTEPGHAYTSSGHVYFCSNETKLLQLIRL